MLLSELKVKTVSELTLKAPSFSRLSRICKQLKKHALLFLGSLHCPGRSAAPLEFITRDAFGLQASRSLTRMQVPGDALLAAAQAWGRGGDRESRKFRDLWNLVPLTWSTHSSAATCKTSDTAFHFGGVIGQ